MTPLARHGHRTDIAIPRGRPSGGPSVDPLLISEDPMRILFGAALAVLFLALPVAGQTLHEMADEDAELVALDRRLFETQILDQDPELLLSRSADSYTVVAPGGVIESRDRVIAGLRAFERVDSLTYEPVQVVRHDETAIVFSRILIHGALMGPLGRLPKLATLTVYTRNGSGWTVLSRALTPCDPRAVERGLC